MGMNEFLAKHGTSVKVKKGDYIFRQGDKHNTLYFVESGLLKAYYVSSDGKENIKSFIKPSNVIGSLSAAYQALPCTFNLLALDECQLLKFEFSALQKAANENHDIAKQLIDVLLMHSMKKEQREYEFLMLDAESRYMNFLQRDPELAGQLTQNDIAKYLGITPVALSRIKSRMQI